MIVHFNSRLVPAHEAHVSVFDRGFLFGDGVYEGLRSTVAPDGSPRVIGLDLHVERLHAGLREARIGGFDASRLGPLTLELLEANALTEAFIYWQITRGTPPGDAGPARPRVPRGTLPPTVVGFATPVTPVAQCLAPELRRVALCTDTRWTRGHLKSISLLGGVLAALEADERGADDAIMERGGLVTEGTATNVFLLSRGRLVTPSLESAPMLAGVTRAMILRADPSIEQRPVRVEELRGAQEVMIVGTKTMVASVVSIDGRPVGTIPAGPSAPAPGAMRLLETLRRAIADDVREQARREAAPAPRPPLQGVRP